MFWSSRRSLKHEPYLVRREGKLKKKPVCTYLIFIIKSSCGYNWAPPVAYDSKVRLCRDILAIFHLDLSDTWPPHTMACWPLPVCTLDKAFFGCSPTQERFLELASNPKRIKHCRAHVNHSYPDKQEKKKISRNILHEVGGDGMQQITCYLKSKPTCLWSCTQDPFTLISGGTPCWVDSPSEETLRPRH